MLAFMDAWRRVQGDALEGLGFGPTECGYHVIASGRCAHAGDVLPGMPSNYDSAGVETDHTTGEQWHPQILLSLRVGTAAIFAHWNVSARALHFHKTICNPPGRKVDPAGLDIATERAKVAAIMRTPSPKPAKTRGKNIDPLVKSLRDALGKVKNPVKLGKVRDALKSLRSIKPKEKR